MKILYKNIFKDITYDYNVIGFEYKKPITSFLKDNSLFIDLLEAKRKVHKYIIDKYENKFKSIYKEGFSLWLESLVNNNFICSTRYSNFKNESEEIKHIIINFIKEKYLPIKASLDEYTINNFKPLISLLNKLDCRNDLIKIEFSTINSFYDDDTYITIYLTLTDNLKHVLISKVKYVTYTSLDSFINPELYLNSDLD